MEEEEVCLRRGATENGGLLSAFSILHPSSSAELVERTPGDIEARIVRERERESEIRTMLPTAKK